MRLTVLVPAAALSAAFALGVAACNFNKYDNYHYCQTSDGRYQIVVSIAHDSSRPIEAQPPRIYDRLCTQLAGGPNVQIDKPAEAP